MIGSELDKMPGPKPSNPVQVTGRQRKILKRIIRRHKTPQCLVWRIRIILKAAQGHSNSEIARRLGKDRRTVRQWRARWVEAIPILQAAAAEDASKRELTILIEDVLSDAFRCGSPGKFTAEQLAQVIAVACEAPAKSERPISHWTPRELADEVIKREIVTSISSRTGGRLLDEADIKPHLSRYWLNAKPDDPVVFECDEYG